MIVNGQKLKDKFLSNPKKKVVTHLSDWQIGVSAFEEKVGRRITVLHYHEPYVWNFYIEFIDPNKGNRKHNRTIWYDYNFQLKKNGKKNIKKKEQKKLKS